MPISVAERSLPFLKPSSPPHECADVSAGDRRNECLATTLRDCFQIPCRSRLPTEEREEPSLFSAVAPVRLQSPAWRRKSRRRDERSFRRILDIRGNRGRIGFIV